MICGCGTEFDEDYYRHETDKTKTRCPECDTLHEYQKVVKE